MKGVGFAFPLPLMVLWTGRCAIIGAIIRHVKAPISCNTALTLRLTTYPNWPII
jgi:hypothetical protein